MIRSLVSIEIDLASSYAIRYACQLGNLIRMEIHPVYVKGYYSQEPTTGIGWVRHTWEREIIKQGKEEIAEMIASEMESCPTLSEPRVIYGDREPELIRLMAQEAFDLYVEGAPYPFNPATIHSRLRMKFYQRLKCPLIWLRGVRPINQIILLCLDTPGTEALTLALQQIWAGCAVPLHLGYPQEKAELGQTAAQAAALLQEAGCQTKVLEPLPSLAGDGAKVLDDYGLVALALERGIRKDHDLLQWLPQVRAPLLLALW
ncbi:MAG: hypothetical protein AB1491_08075 [Thermodesulfobacteriota bacterium]